MRSLFDIRVQKLFAVVLVLKVLSSGLGWWLRMPWSLGFALPLALMTLYIVIGLGRRRDDVTDEKFADSCYYLGFIFTITSIIFGLFDLPEIGTQIESIAVRFGAAMVSTVLGLGVRVYLVSFERDAADAFREAETAVIEASRRFAEQLGIALERLRDFEAELDLAARSSVERVNLQVEALARNHADRLADFFADLASRNREAVASSIFELQSASERMAETVDGYAGAVRAHLGGIDALVTGFLDALRQRLEASMFPPDYFAKYLATPLAQLRGASEDIADHVRAASAAVGDSSQALIQASRRLRERTNTVEGAFDTIARLVAQQEIALQGAQRHMTVLAQVAAALAGLDVVLDRAAAGVEASGAATAALVRRATADRHGDAATRELIEQSAAEIAARLDAIVAQLKAVHRELAPVAAVPTIGAAPAAHRAP
jgi:hypothetical protein